MPIYKHTQIGYLMITVLIVVIGTFSGIYIQALNESASIDSGSNLLISMIMLCTVILLTSFTTLTTSIDDTSLRIQFGYGIFIKQFSLDQIISAKPVKNPWYYGWGIKFWFWPPTWIYNVSGFDAVEIIMKNGRRYRIGTDRPHDLHRVIQKFITLV